MSSSFSTTAPQSASSLENARSSNGLIKQASMMSVLTMLSRVLGLIREQIFATLLGSGAAAEAFQIAFRIPNLLRDLFAEGALSSAFIPIFSRVLHQDSKAHAFILAQRILGFLLLSIGTITLLGYVFTAPLVDTLAPGFLLVEGKSELCIALTRIMLGFLLFVSFAAVAMGMLNAQQKFATSALAPSAFNVISILSGIILSACHMPQEQAVYGWAVGVLLGGLAQFLIQLPALYRTGFRLRLNFKLNDPNVKAVLMVLVPAVIGLSATQINLVMSSRMASIYPGAVSWLNYAFRLLYLPIGVFGVAIASVSTASLSKQIAKHDESGVIQTLAQAFSFLGFLTIPSSVGLWILSEPIIAMIYQHGVFSYTDTQRVAQATACYALGLFAYSGIKVLAPVYYARRQSKIPLYASLVSLVMNVGIAKLTQTQVGFLGMALGTSAAAWGNFLFLLVLLKYSSAVINAQQEQDQAQIKAYQMRCLQVRKKITTSFIKSAIAAGIMGIFGHFIITHTASFYLVHHAWQRALYGLVLTILCSCIYLFCAHFLKQEEMTQLINVVRRKIKH